MKKVLLSVCLFGVSVCETLDVHAANFPEGYDFWAGVPWNGPSGNDPQTYLFHVQDLDPGTGAWGFQGNGTVSVVVPDGYNLSNYSEYTGYPGVLSMMGDKLYMATPDTDVLAFGLGEFGDTIHPEAWYEDWPSLFAGYMVAGFYGPAGIIASNVFYNIDGNHVSILPYFMLGDPTYTGDLGGTFFIRGRNKGQTTMGAAPVPISGCFGGNLYSNGYLVGTCVEENPPSQTGFSGCYDGVLYENGFIVGDCPYTPRDEGVNTNTGPTGCIEGTWYTNGIGTGACNECGDGPIGVPCQVNTNDPPVEGGGDGAIGTNGTIYFDSQYTVNMDLLPQSWATAVAVGVRANLGTSQQIMQALQDFATNSGYYRDLDRKRTHVSRTTISDGTNTYTFEDAQALRRAMSTVSNGMAIDDQWRGLMSGTNVIGTNATSGAARSLAGNNYISKWLGQLSNTVMSAAVGGDGAIVVPWIPEKGEEAETVRFSIKESLGTETCDIIKALISALMIGATALRLSDLAFMVFGGR